MLLSKYSLSCLIRTIIRDVKPDDILRHDCCSHTRLINGCGNSGCIVNEMIETRTSESVGRTVSEFIRNECYLRNCYRCKCKSKKYKMSEHEIFQRLHEDDAIDIPKLFLESLA